MMMRLMMMAKRFRGTEKSKGDTIYLEVVGTERACVQDRKRLTRPTVIQSRQGRKREWAGGRGCCAHVWAPAHLDSLSPTLFFGQVCVYTRPRSGLSMPPRRRLWSSPAKKLSRPWAHMLRCYLFICSDKRSRFCAVWAFHVLHIKSGFSGHSTQDNFSETTSSVKIFYDLSFNVCGPNTRTFLFCFFFLACILSSFCSNFSLHSFISLATADKWQAGPK